MINKYGIQQDAWEEVTNKSCLICKSYDLEIAIEGKCSIRGCYKYYYEGDHCPDFEYSKRNIRKWNES